MLFLKYLDDLEEERQAEAQMESKPFNALFEPQYRWTAWAALKLADGKPDLDNMRIISNPYCSSETIQFNFDSLLFFQDLVLSDNRCRQNGY